MHKATGLSLCGACLTVVAPDLDPGFFDLAELTIHRRRYEAGEARGYRLVVAATGIDTVDMAVSRDAEAAGAWVNCVDSPSECSFSLPAIHRDGPLLVAVSTEGASPALASWVRDMVAREIAPGLGELIEVLAGARMELKREGISTAAIQWRGLIQAAVAELAGDKGIAGAHEVVSSWVKNLISKERPRME